MPSLKGTVFQHMRHVFCDLKALSRTETRTKFCLRTQTARRQLSTEVPVDTVHRAGAAGQREARVAREGTVAHEVWILTHGCGNGGPIRNYGVAWEAS